MEVKFLKNMNFLIGGKIFEKYEFPIYEIQKNFFLCYIYMTDELENFQDKKTKILHIVI